MQRTQAPVFKELGKLFGDMPPRSGPAGGRPGGGMRGGGSMAGGATGGGAQDSPLPDTVRTVISKLPDIQDSFRDRARGQLSESQRARADSLQQAMLEKEREKRRERR